MSMISKTVVNSIHILVRLIISSQISNFLRVLEKMQYLELQWHVLTMQYTRKMQNSIVFLHQVFQIFKWKIFASSCGLLQKRM